MNIIANAASVSGCKHIKISFILEYNFLFMGGQRMYHFYKKGKHFNLSLILVWVLLFIGTLSADRKPVLFVHGWRANAKAWDTMIEKLINDGWSKDILFAQTFSDPDDFSDGANERNAQEIAAWIHEIFDKTNCDKINIVSHSMGGLSTRFYVKYLGGDTNTFAYISLASPHHGTTLSPLGDMKPGSPFLEKLNTGDETPGGILADSNGVHIPGHIRWYSFRSTTDQLVKPAETVIIDGAENRVRDISHTAFLTDEIIYAWVKSALVDTTTLIAQTTSSMNSGQAVQFTVTKNPHTGTILIDYNVPYVQYVTLSVISASGQHIKTVLHQHHPAGAFRTTWDYTNNSGNRIASGMYYCLIQNQHQISIKPIYVVQ